MRHSLRLAFALSAASVLHAQNWYVPDNVASAGTCNAIPFGSGVGSTFANCKYQTRFTAADLGATVNVITGLGFAGCTTGRVHFDSLEVVLDHIPPSQPTTTTFANNLTPAAVTVLSATNYTWNVTSNAWNEIGLQVPFVYNGTDDVILQITTVGSVAAGSFHRATRERIYWTAASGTAPATGTSGLAAGKVEISMLMARTASLGDGCLGSNGTPAMGFTGSPQQGTTIQFTLANGVPNGVGVLLAGVSNAAPLPLDLVVLGAPSCYVYTDSTFSTALLLDGAGAGASPLVIPPALVGFRFFAQFAVLDLAANALGITTSNYFNVLTGN